MRAVDDRGSRSQAASGGKIGSTWAAAIPDTRNSPKSPISREDSAESARGLGRRQPSRSASQLTRRYLVPLDLNILLFHVGLVEPHSRSFAVAAELPICYDYNWAVIVTNQRRVSQDYTAINLAASLALFGRSSPRRHLDPKAEIPRQNLHLRHRRRLHRQTEWTTRHHPRRQSLSERTNLESSASRNSAPPQQRLNETPGPLLLLDIFSPRPPDNSTCMAAGRHDPHPTNSFA